MKVLFAQGNNKLQREAPQRGKKLLAQGAALGEEGFQRITLGDPYPMRGGGTPTSTEGKCKTA
jgi:hypothetical protein